MKQDSWTSEFRKKRFYENQAIKKEKKLIDIMNNSESSNNLFTKTIAVMLDLEGTCDYIDEKKSSNIHYTIRIIKKKIQSQSMYH